MDCIISTMTQVNLNSTFNSFILFEVFFNYFLDELVSENSSLIHNLIIRIDEIQLKNGFPAEFQISFNEFDRNFSVKFLKTSDPINEMNIYLIDGPSGNPIKYNSTYKEVNSI